MVTFTIPPLRDRLSDIEPLATHFVSRFNQIHHKEIKGITKSALQYCLQYPWPGNVRELENVMERAVILSPGEFIVPESLPPKITESKPILSKESFKNLTLEEAMDRAEKQILLEALESFSWNRQLSARTLGISRTTLFNKMRRFQLVDPRRSSAGQPHRTRFFLVSIRRPGPRPLPSPRGKLRRRLFLPVVFLHILTVRP